MTEREQRIYNFLSTCPDGVLSSVSKDGRPHGSVIYFAIDKEFVVTFLTKNDTRKYENLASRPNIMLTVYEPESQTTAQITGKVEEIKGDLEINNVAAKVLAASQQLRDGNVPPISKLEAGSYVAFRLKPDQIRMAVYARPDAGDYAELFESIECFELRET